MNAPQGLTVVICDDDPMRSQRWKSEVERQDVGQVVPLSGRKLAAEITRLNQRRTNARQGRQSDEESVLDAADVLVLDYDLTPDTTTEKEFEQDDFKDLLNTLRNQSGEVLAYLARGFSTAGPIVLVNQRFKETTFDVTMQRFAQSHADLNVTDRDLGSTALWSARQTLDGYNPWHWPILNRSAEAWPRLVESIDLDEPVLDRLDLSWDLLASKQQDLLSSAILENDLEGPEGITFDHLVNGTDLGLDAKDVQDDPRLRSRIAASVATRWVRQYVWKSQSVLIDLPHAVTRYPQLLGPEVEDPETWAAVADKRRDDWTGVLDDELLRTLTPSTEWTPVPTVRADRLRDVALELGSVEWTGEVFCEDSSRFLPESDARPVVTDVPGPYQQRWIEKVAGVRYDPPRRLLA